MTPEEAVAAVEATLDPATTRVDRVRARQDAASYLLVVLDISRGRGDGGPVPNGPRLVDKMSGTVTRLPVGEAVRRAETMSLVWP